MSGTVSGTVSGQAEGSKAPAEDLAFWWHEVSSAALLGTARRGVPEPPALGVEISSDGARRLLDQVSLGTSLRSRPGTRQLSPPQQVDIAAEQRSAAPEHAVQLLRLLLEEPPVPERLARRLVVVWLRACDGDFCRVPGDVLPRVLDVALRDAEVRRALQPVLGEAGRRICAMNPAWQRAVEPAPGPPPSYASWRDLPQPDRVAAYEALRRSDPATARSWLEACWDAEPARSRAALLPLLAHGLSGSDETLAERGLDDRSSSVRESAWQLLDGLPDSARAQRAGAALEPLVTASRVRGRRLSIEDPPEVDAGGRRDGLAAPAPRGVDQARWRVRRMVAAAPLSTLPTLTGWTPSEVVSAADDDVVAGLVAGAVAEGGGECAEEAAEWAEPLLQRIWEPRLLALLGADLRARLVAAHLTSAARSGEVASLRLLGATLHALPGRWPDSLARPVTEALMHPKVRPEEVREVIPVLLERLPRAALPQLEKARSLRLAAAHVAALDDVRRGLEMRGTIAQAFR